MRRIRGTKPEHFRAPRNSRRRIDANIASFAKMLPFGQTGTPEDIARVAVFLASADSSYITGQVLTVDGGLTLGAVAAD